MHASYHCFVYWLIVSQFIFYKYVEASMSIGKTYSINIYIYICICIHSSPLYTIKVDCCISNRSQYDRRHMTQIALYSVLAPWLYTGETETNGMINDTPTYHDVPTYIGYRHIPIRFPPSGAGPINLIVTFQTDSNTIGVQETRVMEGPKRRTMLAL